MGPKVRKVHDLGESSEASMASPMAEHLKVWGLFYRWVQRLFSLFDGYYIYRWWFSGYCQCLMVIVIVDGYNGRSHRFVLTCTLLLFFWLHVVFVSLCRRCSKRSRTQKQLGTLEVLGRAWIVWKAAAMRHTTWFMVFMLNPGFPQALIDLIVVGAIPFLAYSTVSCW